MNTMVKNSLLLTLLSIGTTSPIVLQSRFIKDLDGTWPAFDGETIKNLVGMLQKIRAMTLGEIVNQQTKERVGMYSFRGKKYGIASLAELEKQLANDKAAQHELQGELTKARVDFSSLTKIFLVQIQRFKKMIIEIMQESCQKHNTPYSFMLSWAYTQDGHEEETFNSSMTSFQQFNTFLNELSNFMLDIYQSCPKGRKQYEEKYRTKT